MGVSKIEFEHNRTEKGQRAAIVGGPNFKFTSRPKLPFAKHKKSQRAAGKRKRTASEQSQRKRGSERVEQIKSSFRRKKMVSFTESKLRSKRSTETAAAGGD
ncbi:hypothetical protein Fot_05391 [Forsythia ovata]|uniref:Uncharacterized protein n=1 Tax=Forsythia ovata TaxID=205694 RepID=A0ABD1WQ00_9LAMI